MIQSLKEENFGETVHTKNWQIILKFLANA